MCPDLLTDEPTVFILTHHQAVSYAICVVSADGRSSLTKHTAPNSVDLITHFMDSVFEQACQSVDAIMDNDLPSASTGEEEKRQH